MTNSSMHVSISLPGLEGKLDAIQTLLEQFMEKMMTVASDINDNYDKLVAKVDKLSATDDSLVAYVNGLKKQLQDMADAAANSGSDDPALVRVRDGLVALADRIDAEEAKTAVISA